jgi:hypothetical protein
MDRTRIKCSRGFLRCKIRSHNHHSNNIGVFFGYTEDLCNVVDKIHSFNNSKYIEMYKNLNSYNIRDFMVEIGKEMNNDFLYFIIIYNICCTYYGKNFLLKNPKFHRVLNIKKNEISEISSDNKFYDIIKFINNDCDVMSYYEMLVYCYDSCQKDSDFYKNVDDSNNIFSKVVEFL